jgi:acyl dehydratase
MNGVWPKPLKDAQGPIRADKLDGAAAGMGEWGAATRALHAAGWVPPDMLTGMTLFLLSCQPRDPDRKQVIPGGGVAGGVWVRERFTIHRPLHRDEVFMVRGASEGRHVHKARRYGTTSSVTLGADGERVCTNLTTGLLAYLPEPGLTDGVEGRSPDDLEAPSPDWRHAADNPSHAALAALVAGEVLGSYPVRVSLALMEARDTKRPDNPIHSDPELARRAGLAKPIAGGSHVLAFALEPILARVGNMALLYGANFDIRWKSPVYADRSMRPRAVVESVADDRVVFSIEATLEDGSTAMQGRVVVPLVSGT